MKRSKHQRRRREPEATDDLPNGEIVARIGKFFILVRRADDAWAVRTWGV